MTAVSSIRAAMESWDRLALEKVGFVAISLSLGWSLLPGPPPLPITMLFAAVGFAALLASKHHERGAAVGLATLSLALLGMFTVSPTTGFLGASRSPPASLSELVLGTILFAPVLAVALSFTFMPLRGGIALKSAGIGVVLGAEIAFAGLAVLVYLAAAQAGTLNGFLRLAFDLGAALLTLLSLRQVVAPPRLDWSRAAGA